MKLTEDAEGHQHLETLILQQEENSHFQKQATAEVSLRIMKTETLVLTEGVKCSEWQQGTTAAQLTTGGPLMSACSYNVLCLQSAMPRYIYLCDFQRTESYSKMLKTLYVHILTQTQVLLSRTVYIPSLLHSPVNNVAGILGTLTRNLITICFDIITSTIFRMHPCYVRQAFDLCKSRDFLFVTSFTPTLQCIRRLN